MATQDQLDFAERLRAALDEIASTDIDNELVRERELGEQSFLGQKELLQTVADYCRSIKDLEWDDLTPDQITVVGQPTMYLRSALYALKEFHLGLDGNLVEEKAKRIAKYETAFFSLKEAATPLVGALMLRELDIEGVRHRLVDEADQALAEARERATSHIAEIDTERRRLAKETQQARAQETKLISEGEQFRSQMRQGAEESKRILGSQRAAAADTGVEYQAGAFAEAAERHEAAAGRWLLAAIGTGVATVVAVVLIVVLWEVRGDISEADVLQLVLAKGVVLAVGLYFTFTAGRIYRANAHLTVVNRHREDSLRTYRAIAEAASEQETKSKVLLEAAHAMFGQVPTGLAPTKEGGNTVEVLDGAASVLRRT